MTYSLLYRVWGVSFYLATLVIVFGQTTPASSAQAVSSIPVNIQAYQQEQQALAQEQVTLIDQGATQAQLAAWQKQNASRFAAQLQRAQVMAAESSARPLPANFQPNIPANASQTLKDYLTTQVSLANAAAQLHNQLVQGIAPNSSSNQLGQAQQQVLQALLQEHAQDLQLQAQRAQALAAAGASIPVTVPDPGSPMIPANASPQLAAFMKLRSQLMRAHLQFMNQYATADPAVRQAALNQWLNQNKAQFQQMQQLAQNLAQAGSNN